MTLGRHNWSPGRTELGVEDRMTETRISYDMTVSPAFNDELLRNQNSELLHLLHSPSNFP